MHVKVGDVSAAHGARYFLIGTHARTHIMMGIGEGRGGRGQHFGICQGRTHTRTMDAVVEEAVQNQSLELYLSKEREHFGGGLLQHFFTGATSRIQFHRH